jgi:hypothetical protein
MNEEETWEHKFKGIKNNEGQSGWRTPHSLKDSNASPKVEIMEEKRVGVRFLVHCISGVEGHAGAPGWGLGRVTSELINHMNLHKPNNKLVNACLEHFWCTDKPRAYTNS